jgi:hypothetical protein
MPSLNSEKKDRPPFLKEDFFTLLPDETFSLKTEFAIRGLVIRRPGDYTLYVMYEPLVTKEYVPRGKNVWTRDYGRIYARPIGIRVTE